MIAGAYVAAFTLWNPDPVAVYGFKWGEDIYWQKLPTAYLPLIGAGIGIVIMCLADLANWAAMRGRIKHCNSQIGKAKVVIDQQRQRIAELEGSLSNLCRPKVAEPAQGTAPAEEPVPAAETLGDDEVI
jgi:hypothetical protein